MTDYDKLIELLNTNFSISHEQQQGGISSFIGRMKTAHNKNEEQCPEVALEAMIKKHNSSYNEIFEIIAARQIIGNRTKHNFKTWELVISFREENKNTGDYWEEQDGTFSVYKY